MTSQTHRTRCGLAAGSGTSSTPPSASRSYAMSGVMTRAPEHFYTFTQLAPRVATTHGSPRRPLIIVPSEKVKKEDDPGCRRSHQVEMPPSKALSRVQFTNRGAQAQALQKDAARLHHSLAANKTPALKGDS